MRWPSFRRHARPSVQVFDRGCLAAFAVAIVVAFLLAAVLLGRAGCGDRLPAPRAADGALLENCRADGPAAGVGAICCLAWAEARRAVFSPVEVTP